MKRRGRLEWICCSDGDSTGLDSIIDSGSHSGMKYVLTYRLYGLAAGFDIQMPSAETEIAEWCLPSAADEPPSSKAVPRVDEVCFVG